MLNPRVGLGPVLAALLCFTPGAVRSGNIEGAQPTRIVSGVPSANRLLEDLNWIVGKLAGEQETWDDTLQPAAEVFLIGVDPDRPVGADVIFDQAGGQRKQFQIPLDDLQVFRDENLEPIDIQSRRQGGPDFFKLTSQALGFEGWMRIVDKYASISKEEQDVPASMPSPKTALDALLVKADYDAALAAKNDTAGLADRKVAFQRYRETMLEAVQRRPTETAEAFALRRRLAEHHVERLERLFVEAESLTAGWTTDADKEEARGELLLTALAGSELAQDLSRFGDEASFFASIPTTEDALVHGRMNIPISNNLQTQADQFYQLVGPVWKQRIDGDDRLSPEQKAARHQICDLGLELLHAGRALKALDACIEVTPTENGTNVIIAGIRTAAGETAVEIVKAIPAAIDDIAVELEFETVGSYALHRIKMTGKIPNALKSFYGDEGEMFVATSTDVVWLATGSGALDKLKASIALTTDSKAEATGDVFIGRIRLGPTLKHLDELATEVGFSLEQFIGHVPATPAESESEGNDRRPGEALMQLDLRGIALPVLLEGADDHVSIEVKQQGGLRADIYAERGVLKAAGKVIARVAAKRLK